MTEPRPPQTDVLRRGSTVLIAITALMMIALLIPGLMQAFKYKSQAQTDFQFDDAMNSIVKAVATRAYEELRPMLKQYPGGAFPAGFPQFTALQKKGYPKGDPLFRIDMRQLNGNRFTVGGVPSWWVVPETDPQVWISTYAWGAGANRVYPLRIQMQVCRIPVPGRPFPAAAPYMLGAAWAPACPAAHLFQVNYTGLIPFRNL